MTRGLQVGRELAFEQAEVKIGRTSENDLVLHDHGVSRRHARITARGGQYFAEDVGSANGTQLNGQPLGGEKQLRDGDRLTVGPVEFTFVWMPPEDGDDVTRPIRRALAPPHAQVSPQGMEQASLAEIEAAPTSYQQALPAMARPASPAPAQRAGAGGPAAKGPATPAMPLSATPALKKPVAPAVSDAAVPPPKPPPAPDLPVVGAASQGRTSAPGLQAVGAAASGRASGPGLPAVGASTPNRTSAPGLPAVSASTSNRTSAPGLPEVGASASGKTSAPGLPEVGASASGKTSAPGLPEVGASASGKISASGLPEVGASASGKATAPAASGAGAPVRKKAAPGLPGVGAPALNRPALGGAAARVAAAAKAPSARDAVGAPVPSAPNGEGHPASPSANGKAPASSTASASVNGKTPAPRNAVASVPLLPPIPALTPPSASPSRGAAPPVLTPPVTAPTRGAAGPAPVAPGLPVLTPPGLMPPPPATRAPAFSPPESLSAVDPDEPEERTQMAIPAVESLEPGFMAPPVAAPELPFADADEPEERTQMAIPVALATPPLNESPPHEAPPALPPTDPDEPEERTVLDLRPIARVSPLVAPPMLHGVSGAVASAAAGSEEPATFVGTDDDLPPASPVESPEPPTFMGKDVPGAVPNRAPPLPPSALVAPLEPEPATFTGQDPRVLAEPPPALDPGLLLGEADLLAAQPPADASTTESGPTDPDASQPPVRSGPVTVVAKVEPSSAADEARRRRRLARTLGGQFVLFWQRQSRLRRIGYASVAGLVLLVTVFGVLSVVSPTTLGLPGREPYKLGLQPVTDSFGLGQGVRWVHVDDKAFDFRFMSPTRAVAVLHYQASNITKDEVNLSLNGVSLGWVPPDTAQTAERELEQVLPPGLLRRNENNQLLFDNALNPPGRESWRIWNLRLEVIPVPELPPDQLLASAREAVKAGARFYELRDVGAENLFNAWREYRSAWITLEALDDKPDLYEDVRERIAQISTELDHRCGQLMLEFQRAVQYRSRRDAVATLEDVRRRFPTTEHRCHNLALEKAYEHEL
nr:FHA domain-containing protein [Corallococcus llansteffanensis]